MQQAFQFCAERVRAADRDRYIATLFAPEQYRAPLFALYAFDSEIAQVRDRINSPLPGEVRLQWWRDVLTELERDDAAAGPVATGLLATVRRYDLPVRALLDAVDAHTFDLYDEPMETQAALEGYAVGASSGILQLAARILNDGAEPGLEAPSRNAGIAATIKSVLLQLPLHLSRGQRYLPDDLLARHGVDVADLQVGRITPQLRDALGTLRAIARKHLDALRTAGEGVPDRLLSAFLPIALIPAALVCMERDDDPFHPPIVPQWRRQWTMWRAARDPARFIGVRPSP